MDKKLNEVLMAGEQPLLVLKPGGVAYFTRALLPYTIFALLFVAFVVFLPEEDFSLVLTVTLLVLIAPIVISVPILYIMYRNSVYAVTNKRVIALGGLFGTCNAVPLRLASPIGLKESFSDKMLGTGTITFCAPSRRGLYVENKKYKPLAFSGVAYPRENYELINKLIGRLL